MKEHTHISLQELNNRQAVYGRTITQVLAKRTARRFGKICSMIDRNSTSLLDVGCAAGSFLRFVRKKRKDIVLAGLDVHTTRMAVASTSLPGAVFILGDIIELAVGEIGSYDTVVALQVLEHLPGPYFQQVLVKLAALATKELIVSVPYRQPYPKRVLCHICGGYTSTTLHKQFMLDEQVFRNFLPEQELSFYYFVTRWRVDLPLFTRLWYFSKSLLRGKKDILIVKVKKQEGDDL